MAQFNWASPYPGWIGGLKIAGMCQYVLDAGQTFVSAKMVGTKTTTPFTQYTTQMPHRSGDPADTAYCEVSVGSGTFDVIATATIRRSDFTTFEVNSATQQVTVP